MTVMPLFDYNNSRYRPEKSNPLRQDVKRHYNRLANSLGQWSWYNNSDVSAEIIERVPHWAAKVADLGCGPGILAYELLRSRPALDSFYAIDISPKMIGLASGRISKFAVAELVESDWLTQAYDVRNLDCVILKNLITPTSPLEI